MYELCWLNTSVFHNLLQKHIIIFTVSLYIRFTPNKVTLIFKVIGTYFNRKNVINNLNYIEFIKSIILY